MFDLLNELRDTMTGSTIYQALVDADSEFTANSYLTLDDGSVQYLNYGGQSIKDVISEIQNTAGGLAPLQWSEGLASAS